MTHVSSQVKFFLSLAKTDSILTRRFDGSLGGLGFSDFIILYHLSQAGNEKLRRVDLAEKVGLTASGITRLLAPMEKIGLIKREKNQHDARVSFVALATGGKRKLVEALEDAELLARKLIPASKINQVEELSLLLSDLAKSA